MRGYGPWLWRRGWPTWVCGLLLLASEGWAGSGGTISLPVPGQVFRRPSGLGLEISSYWVEASGYRPVQVDILSPRPATADRTLFITLAPVNWYPYRDSQQVQFELVLPQGATRASRTVSVPQYSIWQQWSIEVYEDGRQLEDLSSNGLGWPRTGQRWEWTEAFPAMLFIDRDAPAPDNTWRLAGNPPQGSTAETRQLPNIHAWTRHLSPDDVAGAARAMARVTSQGQIVVDETEDLSTAPDAALSDQDLLRMLPQLANVELMPPAVLPDDWINYTCFDLIVISLDDLAEFSDRYPQAWTAVHRYITTGGNLLVYGVGQEFSRLGVLQTLLDGRAPSRDTQLLGSADGWRLPDRQNFGQEISDSLRTGEYVQSFGPGGVMIQERIDVDGEKLRSTKPKSVPEPLFCLRPLMLGRVVAIGPDEPFAEAESEAQRDWMLAELGVNRWQWYNRHGLSQHRVNDSFWEFLIPGVGAAPVKAFLLIITAFVITIGPLNYWLLRRWKRLYLLLITVPLGAAVVTGCLLLYALVSDGLATRTRLRSFTEINSTEGTAVSWSRQSYYAGLAPSGGLIFPKQAAVYAIDPLPAGNRRRQRRLVWDERQRLVAGYLPSRTTGQFLVIHAGPTPLGLQIERIAGGSEVTVQNQLQTDIAELIVYDEGQAFWGQQLSTGQTARLAAVGPGKVE